MNGWVWSNGGMILTGENLSAGKKHYTVWVVDGWMSMEQWWNDTDRGKLKYCEKNIIQRGWYLDEWVWSNGGMILTGENWSTGRKSLYSVGGRWMNEYGAMVEWYWQGNTEVLGEKHYKAWVVDEWMSMEQWWNDTDRGNWSAGRKTLYSVGGRWMNEYGAMVEWYWQGKTEVLWEEHYIAWVVDEWMSMEQWWNDTARGKLMYWEKNIIQCGW